MMNAPRFLFSDPVYFVRLNEDKSLYIGKWCEGERRYTIPWGHAYWERVYETTTRAEVETHHNDLVEAFGD
jgi:hypothetical protein